MEARSIVEICGRHGTKCGYCKADTKTSLSYGMMAKRLTCQDYQDLIDGGWRRSGTFLYKPVNHETCCPQYTIRLDVSQFKPTKNQRHVLNRLRRYLDNSEQKKKVDVQTEKEANKQRHAIQVSIDEPMVYRRPPSPPPVGSANNNGKAGRAKGGSKKDSHSSNNSNSSNISENDRTKRKEKRKGGGSKENEAAELELLVSASQKVADAVILATADKGGALSELPLEEGWEVNLSKWSQVKPIRSKTCQVSGGGFFTTAALNIVSAARKRGWKGTGGGAAVGIAKAIAARMVGGDRGGEVEGRSGGTAISDVVVARNGFINFAAGSLEELPAPTTSSGTNTEKSSIAPISRSSKGETKTDRNGSRPMDLVDGATSGNIDSERGGEEGRHRQGGASTTWPLSAEGIPAGTGNELAVRMLARRFSVGNGAGDGEVSKVSAEDAKVARGRREGEKGAVATALEWMDDHSEGSVAMHDVQEASAPGEEGGGDAGSSKGSGNSLSNLPPLDPSCPSHRMTISTVPARLTDEVFRLYRKYQVTVHGDDPAEITSDQFRRFLVDSPLVRRARTRSSSAMRTRDGGGGGGGGSRGSYVRGELSSGEAMEAAPEGEANEETEGRDSLSVPYGSYHQLYRVDGRLVAVGVVDILPTCLSSVYCFYDPDFRALSLGKVTALKETEFVRAASELRPKLRDYYMGFYIHTCPKMSYKGCFAPSFLLCPERLSWVPLELCRPVLNSTRYARLSDLLLPASPQLSAMDIRADTARRATESTLQQKSTGSDKGGARGSRGAGQRQSSLSSTSSLPSSKSPVPPSAPSSRKGDDPQDTTEVFPMDLPEDDPKMSWEMQAAAVQAAADAASGLHDIPLLVGNVSASFKMLASHYQDVLGDALRMYANFLGPDLTRRIILKLQ